MYPRTGKGRGGEGRLEWKTNEEKAERKKKERVIHSICSSGLLQLLFAWCMSKDYWEAAYVTDITATRESFAKQSWMLRAFLLNNINFLFFQVWIHPHLYLEFFSFFSSPLSLLFLSFSPYPHPFSHHLPHPLSLTPVPHLLSLTSSSSLPLPHSLSLTPSSSLPLSHLPFLLSPFPFPHPFF